MVLVPPRNGATESSAVESGDGEPRPRTVEAMWQDDVASRAAGMEPVEFGPGRAVLRMRITETMVNGHQIAHGGYLFLLADSTFACACNSHGAVTVAAGADITFVAPVHLGDVLVAEAQERTRYGRSGIYDVTVRRDGAVVAEFRGRSRTIERPRDEQ